MAKLFVSYSRRDSVVARRLIEAFKTMGQEVWVDWEAIPPAVDWLEQIFRGIEAADAFIFMISPDSIASEVCKVEVGRAVLNNKRIIPIVLRDVDPKNTLDDIRKLNWTFLREIDNFEEGLAKVKTAIELDLDWLEEHRRLQVRALEWHRRKDTSLLLHGRDLRNAQHMMQTYTSKDPIPTELQQKYIEHSRRGERTRKLMWMATGAVLITLAILTYWAVNASIQARASEADALEQRAEALKQQGIAEENAALAIQNQRMADENARQADENAQAAIAEKEIADQQRLIAQAQRSAARAQIYQTRTGQLDTSTLLALDSWKKSRSTEAEEILRRNISLLPVPVAEAYQDGSITLLEPRSAGDTFLTLSTDGSLCVRELAAQPNEYCPTDLPPVLDAVLLQSGESIAVVDGTGIVRVVDSATGEVQREINAGASVRDLAVAPDGRTLAIGREDGRIIVMDIDESIDRADNLFLSGGNLRVLSFSPNGRWIAAGSGAGRAAVWRLGSTVRVTLPPHRSGVLTLEFSPNNRFLLTGGADNYVIGTDLQIEQEVFRLLHADWVTDIDFPLSDNSWFATASEDGRVRIWELTTAQERLIMFQDGPVRDISISSSGQWIAATGEDETIRVWSVYSGVEMYQVPLKAQGTSLVFGPEDRLLVSGDEDGKLALWDVSAMAAPVGTTEYGKPVWASQFTPAGERLIAAESNRIRVINAREFSSLGAHPPAVSDPGYPDDIQTLVISPDSQTIGFSTSGGDVFLQDLQTRVSRPVETSNEVSALAFSPDGSPLITGSTQGMLETWDRNNGRPVEAIDLGEPIVSLAASPNELAVGLADRILLLDPETGETTAELPSPGGNPYLAFNQDGSMLASAAASGQVQIWKANSANYSPLQLIQKGSAYAIAFNPEGSLLAVAAVNDVYLVDTANGQEISRIPHRGIVYDVSFSPDGATLATASQKMVQFWEVADLQILGTDELRDAACSRLIENFNESQWVALFGAEQPYERQCESLP